CDAVVCPGAQTLADPAGDHSPGVRVHIDALDLRRDRVDDITPRGRVERRHLSARPPSDGCQGACAENYAKTTDSFPHCDLPRPFSEPLCVPVTIRHIYTAGPLPEIARMG